MIKRFDSVDVATADLADASRIYRQNFGLSIRTEGDEATIAIGDGLIRLRSGAAVSDLIAASGEGLAAVWLEAEDVEAASAALRQAGAKVAPIRIENGRRVVAVDPQSANCVPLYIFDRRG
ncbi:MAG TPA: VOC family protein [Candidatus Binataceae bacterium]|jgi:predicted enzyme related to lactoylglutathione lyase|nr:VOC family protein [Candidatus Binataceae bacterium]